MREGSGSVEELEELLRRRDDWVQAGAKMISWAQSRIPGEPIPEDVHQAAKLIFGVFGDLEDGEVDTWLEALPSDFGSSC